MTREDLDPDGQRRRVAAIALLERFERRVGYLLDVRRQQLGLTLVKQDFEPFRPEHVVVLEGVGKIQRVLVPWVERVALEGDLEAGDALADLSQPELIHPEKTPGCPRSLIDRDRFRCELDGLAVFAVLHRDVRHGVEEVRVLRAQREHVVSNARVVVPLAPQVVAGRQHGHGLQRPGIHLEGQPQFLACGLVIFHRQVQFGLEHARSHQVGIDCQGGLDPFQGVALLVELHRARLAQQRLGVPGVPGEHVVERGVRVDPLVGPQEELAGQSAGVQRRRVGGDGLVRGA